MKVQDLLKRLSFGALSNLSMSSNANGTINADAQPKLITHANEGLLRLYSRFVLSEKEVLIELVDGITNYHLLKRYAETNCDETANANDLFGKFARDQKYIKDGADPFLEDVIKILEVYGSDGEKLPLNDGEDKKSVFTPNPIMIQVPDPVDGELLSVLYQACHTPLEYGVLGADIMLPIVLEGALESFVAGKVFSNMNGAENSAKGSEHMNNFEAVCIDVLAKDLVNSSRYTSNTKFSDRGFI